MKHMPFFFSIICVIIFTSISLLGYGQIFPRSNNSNNFGRSQKKLLRIFGYFNNSDTKKLIKNGEIIVYKIVNSKERFLLDTNQIYIRDSVGDIQKNINFEPEMKKLGSVTLSEKSGMFSFWIDFQSEYYLKIFSIGFNKDQVLIASSITGGKVPTIMNYGMRILLNPYKSGKIGPLDTLKMFAVKYLEKDLSFHTAKIFDAVKNFKKKLKDNSHSKTDSDLEKKSIENLKTQNTTNLKPSISKRGYFQTNNQGDTLNMINYHKEKEGLWVYNSYDNPKSVLIGHYSKDKKQDFWMKYNNGSLNAKELLRNKLTELIHLFFSLSRQNFQA